MFFASIDKHRAKHVKTALEQLGCLQARPYCTLHEGTRILFPLVNVPAELEGLGVEIVQRTPMELAPTVPRHALHQALDNYLASLDMFTVDERVMVSTCFPSSWERYDGYVLLPQHTLQSPLLDRLSPTQLNHVYCIVATTLHITHLAQKARIRANDPVRRPHIQPLYGDWGTPTDPYWAHVVQHGIHQVWAPYYTMFSAGNVEEKKRIGRLVAKDEVVLDCFGGIGYFVFPLLVHAQVRRVMACDLNAWSLQGMQRGAVLNKIAFHSVTSPTATLAHVTAPLVMYHGDVRDALPLYRHQVDRVHLGLLPSSQVAYESAVLALKPTGGWMHIHGNVEEFQVETWTATTVKELSDYFHQHYDTLWTVTLHRSTCVKSFAPHVHHWVLDMECRPSSPVPVPPE